MNKTAKKRRAIAAALRAAKAHIEAKIARQGVAPC